MSVTLTVCTTCKFKALQPIDDEGKSGGMRLAEALEAEAGNRTASARVIRHECLWNCRNHCTVLIRAPDKPGYLVGRFEGGADAAAAILDWTDAYAINPDGKVPYRQWPEGMKGHFILNIPVLAEEERK
jgi:predicted metal-binding protein